MKRRNHHHLEGNWILKIGELPHLGGKGAPKIGEHHPLGQGGKGTQAIGKFLHQGGRGALKTEKAEGISTRIGTISTKETRTIIKRDRGVKTTLLTDKLFFVNSL